MESTKFSPEQSLQVINQHLQESRKNLAGNSFYYLIWGYLSIAAAISHYILLKTQITPYAFLPWPILMSGGALIVAFYKPKSSSNSNVMSHFDRAMAYLWSSSGLLIVLAVVFCVLHQLSPNPMVHFVTGSATFISGGILRFGPLKTGGIILAFSGIASIFASEANQQIIFAIAMIIGYIYPGLALKSAEKTAS